MSFFFLQQIPEEKAFENMLRDQTDHVRNCLEKLNVMICEMLRVRSLVGNDSLDHLMENQEMENNKLKALTDLIAQTEDAIRMQEGRSCGYHEVKRIDYKGHIGGLEENIGRSWCWRKMEAALRSSGKERDDVVVHDSKCIRFYSYQMLLLC
uniref:Uncharacterized protein n=1 Tax=Tanacetum cinerariifolium TaxID=118510 RepID=A0A699JP56_TANCI|nr:hypothetical protein [Tanacetum cinerariifolium]